VTGGWNLAVSDAGDEQVVLLLKLTAVAVSGATAYLHASATTVRGPCGLRRADRGLGGAGAAARRPAARLTD
jgi:hypothetical protein